MQGLSSSPRSLLLSPSPSLTCYSTGNNTLAEIAARVARELSLQEHHHELVEGDDEDDFFARASETELPRFDGGGEKGDDFEGEDGGDDEFEFAFVCGGPDYSPVSADEIFCNGQIRPMYEYSSAGNILAEEHGEQRRKPRRRPLKLLMSEEPPEPGFSCSSSETDELDGVAAGTYCVWAPRESPGKQCRKSSSARSGSGSGSGSRRWRLKLLLLNRSHSDGRTDTLSAVPPPRKAVGDGPKGSGLTDGLVGRRRPGSTNRTDDAVVGFFANVNGPSRNLHQCR